MPEIKRITLHPLKRGGKIDPSVNLYPKTLKDGIVDREGNEVEIFSAQETTALVNEEVTAERDRAVEKERLIDEAIEVINSKIPAEATPENQLADKAYVDSAVSVSDARFISPICEKFEDLPIVGVNNNDYTFVVERDPNQLQADGVNKQVIKYTEYIWDESIQAENKWRAEYELYNNWFTVDQWAAINSEITAGKILIINNRLDVLEAGKVDKTTSINKVYGTNGQGQDTCHNIDSDAVYTGNIVKRVSPSDDNIRVALAPLASTDAASKNYVDTYHDISKLDKVTSASETQRVYSIDTDGSQTVTPVSSGVSENFIVKRTATGAIRVPETPVDNNEATSKKYVDDNKVQKIAGSSLVPDSSVAAYNAHLATVSGNPHHVTQAEVGLGNVDNKSEATIKSDFTGSIADGNTGFITGGVAYTALAGKVDVDGNKVLSTYDYNDAEKHSNKAVLDGITAQKVEKWDNDVSAKNSTISLYKIVHNHDDDSDSDDDYIKVLLGDFTLNQDYNEEINLQIPSSAADVHAWPDSTNYGESIVATKTGLDTISIQLLDQEDHQLGDLQTITFGQITTNKTNIEALDAYVQGLNLTDPAATFGANGKYIRIISQSNGQVSAEATAFDNNTDLAGASNNNAPSSLAVKTYVDTAVSTNSANFIGTFANITALRAYVGTVTNNDYAFVQNQELATDYIDFNALNAVDKTTLSHFDYGWVIDGSKFDLYRFDIVTQTWLEVASDTTKEAVTLNTAYNRYKAVVENDTVTWVYEYTLNSTTFSKIQWEAINSGINADRVAHMCADDESEIITADWTHSGKVGISNDTDVSASTAALTVAGGVKIAKKLEVGSDTTLNGSVEINNQATGFKLSGGTSNSKDLDIQANTIISGATSITAATTIGATTTINKALTVGATSTYTGSVEIKGKQNLSLVGDKTSGAQTLTFNGDSTFQAGSYASTKGNDPDAYSITVGGNVFDIVTRGDIQTITGEKKFLNAKVTFEDPVSQSGPSQGKTTIENGTHIKVSGRNGELSFTNSTNEHFKICDSEGSFIIQHGPTSATTYTLTLPNTSGTIVVSDATTNSIKVGNTTLTEQQLIKLIDLLDTLEATQQGE